MADNTGSHGGGKANRLIDSASPYLLQHAYNPVDWYPWGGEAFEKARKEDKPIFLSIGYSTCHWCHVMAEESFSNERIAKIMNAHFISIKVDREERPDIDAVYMEAVQMMTGRGGWPMSVFLTADGEPFYGGTYFPPQGRYGMVGFEELLLKIADAWETDRQKLLSSAEEMKKLLAKSRSDGGEKISADVQEKAVNVLGGMFDPSYAGFGRAPKFPQASNLSMLLGSYFRTGNADTLLMVEATLTEMANGGIHDHLGGGFHRYSTDARWLVPHFEKMLYDQALLARAYLQAYRITGKQLFADVAGDVLDYVLNEMTDAGGGFYSAEDADSEGEEGVFYVWSKSEIEKALGKDGAKIFNAWYGVTKGGNFEGANILHISKSAEKVAKELAVDVEILHKSIDSSSKKLFEIRSKRIRPHRDEKIIAGWNGLMVSAFALGGRVLGEDKYTVAGQLAVRFVLDKLHKDGRLMRYYGKGKAVELAVLDDYGFLIMALIDLYEADFDAGWLAEAKGLSKEMIRLFADEENGAFFLTGSDAEKLIARSKPAYDGAKPCGNSVAAMGLFRLGAMTMDKEFTQQGENVLKAFSSQLDRSPVSLCEMIMAVDFYVGPRQEIIIAGKADSADTKAMIDEVNSRFLPRSVVMFHADGKDGTAIEGVSDFIKYQKSLDGKATAYVCENYQCKLPVTDLTGLKKNLDDISGKGLNYAPTSTSGR